MNDEVYQLSRGVRSNPSKPRLRVSRSAAKSYIDFYFKIWRRNGLPSDEETIKREEEKLWRILEEEFEIYNP